MPQMKGIFRVRQGVNGNEVAYSPIPHAVIQFINVSTGKQQLVTETGADGAYAFTIPVGQYTVGAYIKGTNPIFNPLGASSVWEVYADSPNTAFENFYLNPNSGDVDGALLEKMKRLSESTSQAAMDAGVARDDAQQSVVEAKEVIDDFKGSISQKIDGDDETKLVSEAALGKVNAKVDLAKEKADLVGIQANQNAANIADVKITADGAIQKTDISHDLTGTSKDRVASEFAVGELNKSKLDKSSIKQVLGNSKTDTMSQDAVTSELNGKRPLWDNVFINKYSTQGNAPSILLGSGDGSDAIGTRLQLCGHTGWGAFVQIGNDRWNRAYLIAFPVNSAWSEEVIATREWHNASISDLRAKKDVRDLTESELEAISKINFKAFRYKEEQTYTNENAIFFGVIAQQVKHAFLSVGLDATDYNVLIKLNSRNKLSGDDLAHELRVNYINLLILEAEANRYKLRAVESRLAKLEEIVSKLETP